MDQEAYNWRKYAPFPGRKTRAKLAQICATWKLGDWLKYEPFQGLETGANIRLEAQDWRKYEPMIRPAPWHTSTGASAHQHWR